MGIKFDGTYVKDGFKTIANLKDGKILREGQSSGGKALGNIKSGDIIREKDSSGGKTLCNVKDGKNIRDGQSSGGKQLIKISDAFFIAYSGVILPFVQISKIKFSFNKRGFV